MSTEWLTTSWPWARFCQLLWIKEVEGPFHRPSVFYDLVLTSIANGSIVAAAKVRWFTAPLLHRARA